MEAGLSPQRLLVLTVVAVYAPAVETVMLKPVSPFDQFTVQSGQTLSAVSTTDSPEQNVVGPEAEIVVAAGVATMVIEMALELGLSPQMLLTIAE